MIAARPMWRANALPETALVVSLMLMLTLAAIDLATIGFGQAQADGAAFVGARTLAVQNSISSTVADTAISGVFPKVNPNTVVIEQPGGSYVGAEVTLPGQPIRLLNGFSSSSLQIGHTYETTLGSANPLSSSLSVVSDVPCAVIVVNQELPAIYSSIRLAQIATPTNPGASGTNLNFGEFSVHQGVYSQLSLSAATTKGSAPLFPADVSLLTALSNYTLDLANPNGIENTMSGWDTKGSASYPAANQSCTPNTHS